MRPTTAAAGAAALLLAAGLAACSSDPEPGSPLPTGEPVPSATGGAEPTAGTGAAPTTPGAPSPSSEQPVAPPTLPPEATTNDAAGAEAFVRYWYETLNFAYATGDTRPLLKVSSEDCAICLSLDETVSEAYEDGGRLEGGYIELTEVVAPTPDATGAALVSVVFDQEPSTRVSASGQRGMTSTGDQQQGAGVVIERTPDGAAWRMYGVGA